MSPVLPIVSISMAESLKKLGFSDVTPFCYNDGVLTEFQEDLILAPSLQEVQTWIGRRKRLDVLVYREVFFSDVGKFYAVIINRKDGTMRETAKCPTYNQTLETGLKVAINFLRKKKRRKVHGNEHADLETLDELSATEGIAVANAPVHREHYKVKAISHLTYIFQLTQVLLFVGYRVNLFFKLLAKDCLSRHNIRQEPRIPVIQVTCMEYTFALSLDNPRYATICTT